MLGGRSMVNGGGALGKWKIFGPDYSVAEYTLRDYTFAEACFYIYIFWVTFEILYHVLKEIKKKLHLT